MAAVPVIFIPTGSTPQILQLGGSGTVALFPANDSSAVDVGSTEMAIPSQSLQVTLPLSVTPATGAFASVTHNVPVALPSTSATMLHPTVPFLQKACSDAAVVHSEGIVRTVPPPSYSVSVAVQPGLHKTQSPVTQALAAALNSPQINPTQINDLKRLLVSGGQAGHVAAMPQVLVSPPNRQSGLAAGSVRPVAVPTVVSSTLTQALDVSAAPRIIQSAVNVPRTIVLDKSTNQYKLMALPTFPADAGSVPVNHTK